jgi:shikimate dehydrogenase
VTRVRLGVIGSPIAHSLSPIMHRAALDALGLGEVTYDAIDVPEHSLAAELARLGREGFAGLNVTLPHKTRVMAHLARIDEVASEIGAVNTLVREGEAWVGTNTDALGLARSLDDEGVVFTGARVGVLGAGGAARAAVVALRSARELIVIARRPAAATDTARLHPHARVTSLDDPAALDGVDLVIQASSAPLGPDAVAFADRIALDRLPRHAVIVDLVYRPRETVVLARARARGLRTVDGTGMLVHQGAASLERWLGVRAPIAVMRDAVERALHSTE